MEIEQGSFADVGGLVHFRVWDGPAGMTFVLVHGLGGSHINWLSVAPRMAERGGVLALDLPGFGLSPLAGRRSTLEANRKLLSRFVRDQTDGPVVLVGNSMGGAIAILAAADEPTAYRGLALANATVPWSSDRWPNPLQLAAFGIYCLPGAGKALGRLRVQRMGPEQMVDMSFRFLTARPDALDVETRMLHAEMAALRQKDPDSVGAFLEAARSLVLAGVRKRSIVRKLDEVRIPVLLMHGESDTTVPHAWAVAAVRGRPSWELRSFPETGHLVMMEDPQGFLDATWEWMDRTGIGGSVPRTPRRVSTASVRAAAAPTAHGRGSPSPLPPGSGRRRPRRPR